MRERTYKITDTKMSKRMLGSWEPIKFNIILEVPSWFGESIIRLISKKWKERV